MDFDRLRALTAVARTGSIRAAAVALHVTPGAVSKAMARLEQEAGVQILVPEGRGIGLTDEGAWLARRAQHLVGEHASLAHDLATRRFGSSELCIATYDAFAASLPAVVAGQFLPDVPLSLRERWPGEVERAVADAVSDVGVTFTPVPTEGVEHEVVATVSLGVYVVRDAFRGVAPSDLPFAVPSHPLTGIVSSYGPLDGWPADGPAREVRYRLSSLEGRLELCRAGLAALLLPQFVARRHDARAPARLRLELRDPPSELVLARRRVHMVRRATASADDQRVAGVRAAIAAMCTDV